MKHLIFSLLFMFSALAFGSIEAEQANRFAETLETADGFYRTGDLDYFKIAIEAAITHLSQTADSPQRELNIESVNQLVESAQGGIAPEVYQSLKTKISRL